MARDNNSDHEDAHERPLRPTVHVVVGLLSPFLAIASLVIGSLAGYPAVGAACAIGFIILSAWTLGTDPADPPPRCPECGRPYDDAEDPHRDSP